MPHKIFIYNGIGSFEPSVQDLKSLFSSDAIFASTPDVITSDFKFNPDGLSRPLFVIPGGSTSAIGNSIKTSFATIRASLNENFHYLGVCAGGFLGASEADLYFATHNYDECGILKSPEYFVTLDKTNIGLTMIDGIKAVGAFYPHDLYRYGGFERGKTYTPYSAQLQLGDRKINQLYFGGPGFFSRNNKAEVIATYGDKERYSIGSKTIEKPGAWVTEDSAENRGGRLLSGTHFETCVPASKLLSFLQIETKDVKALSQHETKKFIEDQQDTYKTVTTLLATTFK